MLFEAFFWFFLGGDGGGEGGGGGGGGGGGLPVVNTDNFFGLLTFKISVLVDWNSLSSLW